MYWPVQRPLQGHLGHHRLGRPNNFVGGPLVDPVSLLKTHRVNPLLNHRSHSLQSQFDLGFFAPAENSHYHERLLIQALDLTLYFLSHQNSSQCHQKIQTSRNVGYLREFLAQHHYALVLHWLRDQILERP